MDPLQRKQLGTLCSNQDTFKKAESIFRLAAAKTRPGSGFVVKNPVALPAICAYLASQQLNSNEVSLQSAMSAACVTKAEFSTILDKVTAALGTDEGSTVTNATYAKLVDLYRVQPREDVIACMEDAEAAVPRVDILKDKYGPNVFSCAVFYWVCQLVEETSVQERSLRQSYSIQSKPFKAILTTLDKQCDGIAEQIKSYLREKRSSLLSSQPDRVSQPAPASPQKSLTKSAMKPRLATRQMPSTPVTTPSKKRAVVFSQVSSHDDGYDDGMSYPETPTKRRRLDRTTSPTKPNTGNSPAKKPLAVAMAAFQVAVRGGPAKLFTGQESASPVAGPSTSYRHRLAKSAQVMTPGQGNAQSSPSRSQVQATPTRPSVRRRFRPVFLEQQQWCARDPKVERMWAIAEQLREERWSCMDARFNGLGDVIGEA